MDPRAGVIFLDGTEVIIGIYALNKDLRWQKQYFEVRDLATFKLEKEVDPLEIIEIIAELLFMGIKLNIKNWQIIGRNLADEIQRKITQATKLKIKNLNLVSEQELICKGVLNEIFI